MYGEILILRTSILTYSGRMAIQEAGEWNLTLRQTEKYAPKKEDLISALSNGWSEDIRIHGERSRGLQAPVHRTQGGECR